MEEHFSPDFSYKYNGEDEKYIEKEKKASSAKGKSQSVIPGIRELSNYKTKYFEKRQKFQPPKVQEEAEAADPAKPFTVQEWGPQGEVAADGSLPVFFAVFSEPVRAILGGEESSPSSDVMEIQPPLKGNFRWLGSRHLSFEAEEEADPSVAYKISINKKLKSLAGKKLEGPTEFSSKSRPVKITRFYGGYVKDSSYECDSKSGALPKYANRAYVRLNYSMSEKRFGEILGVYIGKNKTDGNLKKARFSVKADYNKKAFPWGAKQIYDEANGKSNSFVVTIEDEIPYDMEIAFLIDGSHEMKSYHSLRPFAIQRIPEQASYSRGSAANPVAIEFSQKIDKSSVAQNIWFDFDFKLSEENFEVKGRTLTIYDLPVFYDEKEGAKNKFKLFIKDGLKDVYGQNLLADKGGVFSAEVKIPAPLSYIKFLDYGERILEAQFKPKLIIESQNILSPSFYKVKDTENPLNPECEIEYYGDTIPPGCVEIRSLSKSQRQFDEIDLSQFLNADGFGWIDFEAHAVTNEWDRWDEKFYLNEKKNKLTIQVTDIGITARVGINKAVVLARSLKENKPIEGAEISVLIPEADGKRLFNTLDFEGDLIAEGKTDKNGLAVIKFDEAQVKKIEDGGKGRWMSRMRILAQKGSDKMIFCPSTHDPWRESVPTQELDLARKTVTRALIFTDRGLYKPGEIVSFRGIVRDQALGSLIPKAGEPYEILVEEAYWEGKEIVPKISGVLSENGGFYGQIKLPDDIESGSYRIRYKLGKEQWLDPYANFTVANFERLKFESSISAPDIVRYGGDKITANLKASCLAGGSLAGADWTSTWFSEPKAFEPDTQETKDYNFGPQGGYYGRNLFANEKGLLSADGEAGLSCVSEKISDGKARVYHVEANVTDISGQRISAAANIMVHPAKFYVGIKKPAEISGFAKKGQKLDFPFILATPEGTILSDKKTCASLEYSLKRETWTMANEQSVDESIYTRWEKSEILEAEGKIEPKTAGKISVELKEAGWHTLTISGRDSAGNWTSSEYGFYATGGSSSWYDRNNSQSISLTCDKNLYNPGEKARLLMESPLPSGDYLITVEREGIFTEELRHFDVPADVIEIPVSINYTPAVYVAVSSYSTRSGDANRQYGEPDLGKPKGCFGIATLNVNPKTKSFNVKIESDKTVYRPGEKATLTITATQGGKPLAGAEITALAVDRGVLDLINYHVPNPLDFFYNKYNFPLCVIGGDSRDMLMDPVTYSVKNLAGGDSDDKDGDDNSERTDFRPTALFEPSIVTDKNGKAVCSFTLPDNLTTYRLTAFGAKGEFFALNESEVKVQNPINVQQVQPRRLRERDTAECGVLITNLDSREQKVTVSLEARSPSKNTAQDELEGRETVPGKAFVDGKSEWTVTVASEGSSVVFFDVAAEKSGTVELVYEIKSEVLNERLVSPILIEKSFVYENVTSVGDTDEGQNEKEGETIVIPSWAKEGRGDLKVTLDATRLGLLGSSVRYLFDYPYGCLEQQSSKVLPLILFAPYIDAFEMDSKVSDPKKCAASFIKSWAKSQHSSGGFPYWPDDSWSANLYVSTRIAHVCAAAVKNGMSEKDMKINLAALKSFIKKELSDKKLYDSEKAYICKVLALLGDSSEGAMNDLYSKIDSLDISATANLGTAFALQGKNARAEEAARKIKSRLQPSLRSVSIVEEEEKSPWHWQSSKSDALANSLELLSILDPNDNMVDRLLFALLQEQRKGYWQNTSTTANVLKALASYIERRNLENTNFEAKAFLDKKEIMSETFKGVAAKPKTLTLPFEGEILSALPKDKSVPLEFEKNGSGRLFYTAQLKYALPDGMQTRRNQGISIDYKIQEADSGALANDIPKDSAAASLESSKLYKATVKIRSSLDRDFLALRCPIPSGAEILDSTFVTSGSAAEIQSSGDFRHWISSKNVRDNEIQFFWNSFKSGESSITFTFRAVRKGVYPTPPVQAQCMYEEEVFGRSDGYLFIIK
mgnify:CR=1 FL=1